MLLKGTTILAVDDDPDSLSLIHEALALHGSRVICAGSGPAAVQILRELTPDVVVLDVVMPDMNGFAVLDIMRRTPGLQNVPVVLQTAEPSRVHGRRTADAGLTYMLAKPLDVHLLFRAVQDCLRAVQTGLRT